jgi:hypothetical protein
LSIRLKEAQQAPSGSNTIVYENSIIKIKGAPADFLNAFKTALDDYKSGERRAGI